MNPGFWKGRRVLITGHTGFKGSWLCLLLDTLGAEVAGYSLPPPTEPSLYRLARVGELIDSVEGDVRNLEAFATAVSRFAPEVILHMAAQSVVLESYEAPVDTYATNVLGTVHLLEAVRIAERPCIVVNVTTDKCYENVGTAVAYGEDDRLGGRDPYSNSKSCSELATAAYRDSFFPAERIGEHGVAVATARAGNVIGGGDWTPWQLIPDLVRAFEGARKVTLRHPQAVRPWQHVLDCLQGYLLLAEKLAADPAAFTGAWNFGPADEDIKPVVYVAETIGKRWNASEVWTADTASHAHEEPILMLDSSKARRELGWRPALPLDTALAWVADWYTDYFERKDARSICSGQIGEYLASGSP